MKTVLFLGFSGSGKTTAIEHAVRALVKQGYRVGTLKHIHDPGFTIDTPGKDTWRHTRAGAAVVVSVAAHEVALIRNEETSGMSLDELLTILKKERVDFAMVEGLYRRFKPRDDLVRIVCAKNKKEAFELINEHRGRVACVTGKMTSRFRGAALGGIPVVRLPDESDALVGLILGEGGPRGQS